MLAKSVRVGGVYRMFVSGYPTAVRITDLHRDGGWMATNLQTGRSLRIRNPDLLGPKYLPIPPSTHVDIGLD